MQGKTVVATGATSGIGEVAAKMLAGMGARIVFIARDARRAAATLATLEQIAPGRGHRFHIADLSLIAETKRVGAEIAASEARIDVLINNAGAMFSDRRVTAEGLELTFALNHMAYFVLTKVLGERLAGTPQARVVSTASGAHRGARLDFADLQCARGYSGMRAYRRSKLANILFTRVLARRLSDSGVTANCLHPGLVATRFGDEAGGWTGRRRSSSVLRFRPSKARKRSSTSPLRRRSRRQAASISRSRKSAPPQAPLRTTRRRSCCGREAMSWRSDARRRDCRDAGPAAERCASP